MVTSPASSIAPFPPSTNVWPERATAIFTTAENKAPGILYLAIGGRSVNFHLRSNELRSTRSGAEAVRLWTVPVGLGAVSVVSRPLGDELLVSEAEDIQRAGVTVLVSMLSREELPVLGLLDEELIVPFVGLTFFHVPTPDQAPPARDGATLALVADLAHRARTGGHVAVHCRAGQGRSPAFACAVLVRAGRSAVDAMHDLSEVRGLKVPECEAQRAWIGWVEQQPPPPQRRERDSTGDR